MARTKVTSFVSRPAQVFSDKYLHEKYWKKFLKQDLQSLLRGKGIRAPGSMTKQQLIASCTTSFSVAELKRALVQHNKKFPIRDFVGVADISSTPAPKPSVFGSGQTEPCLPQGFPISIDKQKHGIAVATMPVSPTASDSSSVSSSSSVKASKLARDSFFTPDHNKFKKQKLSRREPPGDDIVSETASGSIGSYEKDEDEIVMNSNCSSHSSRSATDSDSTSTSGTEEDEEIIENSKELIHNKIDEKPQSRSESVSTCASVSEVEQKKKFWEKHSMLKKIRKLSRERRFVMFLLFSFALLFGISKYEFTGVERHFILPDVIKNGPSYMTEKVAVSSEAINKKIKEISEQRIKKGITIKNLQAKIKANADAIPLKIKDLEQRFSEGLYYYTEQIIQDQEFHFNRTERTRNDLKNQLQVVRIPQNPFSRESILKPVHQINEGFQCYFEKVILDQATYLNEAGKTRENIKTTLQNFATQAKQTFSTLISRQTENSIFCFSGQVDALLEILDSENFSRWEGYDDFYPSMDLSDDCVKCPKKAVCRGPHVLCLPEFKLKKIDDTFYCIPDSDIETSVLLLLKKVAKKLQKEEGRRICKKVEYSAMNFREISEFAIEKSKNFPKGKIVAQRVLNLLASNPDVLSNYGIHRFDFNASEENLLQIPEIFFSSVLYKRPLDCIIKETAIFYSPFVFLLALFGGLSYKFLQKRKKKRLAQQFVMKIIENNTKMNLHGRFAGTAHGPKIHEILTLAAKDTNPEFDFVRSDLTYQSVQEICKKLAADPKTSIVKSGFSHDMMPFYFAKNKINSLKGEELTSVKNPNPPNPPPQTQQNDFWGKRHNLANEEKFSVSRDMQN
eukprot:GHVP01000246.1.p1 GENE.GHVP01000246.1~~GHVP01000246.1.p1  ORF type:complete len:848 (-),score=186.72 GHVP01000246.1:206-2749(-)